MPRVGSRATRAQRVCACGPVLRARRCVTLTDRLTDWSRRARAPRPARRPPRRWAARRSPPDLGPSRVTSGDLNLHTSSMGQRGVSPPRRARLASASLSFPRLLLDTLRLVGGCCVFDDGDEPDRRAHLGREHRHRHRLVISYGDVSHQHVRLRSHAIVHRRSGQVPARPVGLRDMSPTRPGHVADMSR